MATLDLDPTSLRDLAYLVADRLKPIVQRASITGASESVMMTLSEVCAYIKMSRTKFYHLRRGEICVDGEPLSAFPPPRHNGSCVVWQRRDVDAWLECLPRRIGDLSDEEADE